jgi:hypothetical protein
VVDSLVLRVRLDGWKTLSLHRGFAIVQKRSIFAYVVVDSTDHLDKDTAIVSFDLRHIGDQ